MSAGMNLLDGPEPTLLPQDPAPLAALESGQPPAAVAARYPASSLAWAALADLAWSENRVIESYAFARVGYHRGLDALRRNGWKGHGPVPWSHEANRGFLRCLRALGRAAEAIGENDEQVRVAAFITECDPAVPDQG
ncbi:MAG: DUF3151 domain-containing protein [Actinomycetales bacterium]